MAARKSKRPKDSKFTAPLIFLRKSEEEEQRQSGVVKPSLKSFCGEDVRGSSMFDVGGRFEEVWWVKYRKYSEV